MAPPIITPGRCAAVGLLAGLGLAAISGAVGAEGAVATSGILGWLGGVAGNQFQAWFGSKIKEPPPGAEEVFRNHHIRALLGRAIAAAVEKKADWVREERGSVSDLFRDAGEILAVRLGELVDDPSGVFAELREFQVNAILDDFVANEGNIRVLTLELWSHLIAGAPELEGLSEIERADLMGGLHEGFGEALWGLFKHDAATDRQGFAAVELLYLSRILQAVQAIPGSSSVDLSGLVGRIDLLFKEVKQQQVFYFKEILSDILAANRTLSVHTELLLKILAALATPKAPTFDLLHTIPSPPQGFTGREEELDELRQRAAQGGAVITGLKGMGGIGKTALALVLAREWAASFPDAALMLDGKGLAGDDAPSPTKLMEQVILAFHPEAKMPDDPSALAGIYRSVLHGKKVFILLDNAKDAAQAKPLLPPAGCALIVTSRAGFTLDGRAPYAVDRMKSAEAEALLRAAYHMLTEEQTSELIRLCAGLPLALRLVSAHLSLDAVDRGGLADVAGYLEKLGGGRLAYLDADAEDAGEITISETLRLSVELLPLKERRAWQKLAVFTYDFEAGAAENVAGAGSEMLSGFLRRSLLESSGVDRYKLHDLAADYAREQLSPGEIEALALAHAEHYQAIAFTANQLFNEKGKHLAGLTLFDRERWQIETAFAAMAARQDDAAAEKIIWIANASAYIGNLRFHLKQWIDWLEIQLHAARRIGHRRAEGTALGNLGTAYFSSGDPLKAIKYHEQHLEVASEIGDRHGEGTARGNLGTAHVALGNMLKAVTYHEQRLEIAREIGDRRGEGDALGSLGAVYDSAWGGARRAIGYFKQQLEITREIGDRRGESNALGSLGIAQINLRNELKAIEYYEQQLEIAVEIGDRRGEGNALWNSALAYRNLREESKATQRAKEALEILEAIESPAAAMIRGTLDEWEKGFSPSSLIDYY